MGKSNTDQSKPAEGCKTGRNENCTRYPGSKSQAGLGEWICEQLPAHVYFASPFAGKCGVFRQKLPALRSYLIDRDTEIVDWWQRLNPPGTIVTAGDGIRWCELAAEWGPDDLLIYCDPPYLPETRVKKRIYRHEMTPSDHARLLRALRACRCGVTVSGYPSDMYDEALAGWNRVTREVMTRGGTWRTEVLWSNRDPSSSAIAMEYSALGGDFRERERIHRKAKRWTSSLLAMPPREQRAILLALIDATSSRGR